MDLNRFIATDADPVEATLLRWQDDGWHQIDRAPGASLFPATWWPRFQKQASAGDKIEIVVRGRSPRTETYLTFPEGTRMTLEGVVYGNGPEMVFCYEKQVPKTIRAMVFHEGVAA